MRYDPEIGAYRLAMAIHDDHSVLRVPNPPALGIVLGRLANEGVAPLKVVPWVYDSAPPLPEGVTSLFQRPTVASKAVEFPLIGDKPGYGQVDAVLGVLFGGRETLPPALTQVHDFISESGVAAEANERAAGGSLYPYGANHLALVTQYDEPTA